MLKGLTWVQGGDFRSWWFEDKDEKQVGPKVREKSLYYVINGREEDEFESIESARDYVEEIIKEGWRP